VFEDREQYKMLKYVATTPIGLVSYLLGRSLTKFVLATISAILVLAFGIVVLGLRFAVMPLTPFALVAILAVGAVGIVAVGLVLAGLSMVFARQSMMMNEGVSAVLYLFCGVVFPPDLLPSFLRPVALGLPMTYWLEASRRALGVHGFSALLSRLTDPQLAGIFVAVTLVWLVAGRWVFARLERRARAEGLLDITTAW
jgi:ABC-2 type transport system permease protein